MLLFVFLAWAPAAYAWSWPVQGQVAQPFAYDEAHPYAAGQHRGIDIGSDAAGETVVAPAAGTVSFAGSVAANGKSLTIETADGYSVTLTHLASIAVARGATVAEEDAVGTVGPSGTPEVDGPNVHLGIRLTADPDGYVDPLRLLPPPAASPAPDTDTTASQPSSSQASSPAPASKPGSPAPSVARPKTTRVTAHEEGRGRAQAPRARSRPLRSSTRTGSRDVGATHEPAQPRSRPGERTSALRRPFAEPAASEPTRLDDGREIRRTFRAAQAVREPSDSLPGLLCNVLAALVAVGAAVAAQRRRRPLDAGAPVLHLPRAQAECGRLQRAA